MGLLDKTQAKLVSKPTSVKQAAPITPTIKQPDNTTNKEVKLDGHKHLPVGGPVQPK